MKRSIAIISEHASPLVDLGSVDSGGQNVYVAQVAGNLGRLGYDIDIFTRRYDTVMPEIFAWKDNIRVIHVPAGPAEYIRKEKLLDHMGEFTEYMTGFCRNQDNPYDLIHANFWMSGLVAADIKAALGIPFVITFHALGKVRRQYQGKNDEFPDCRFAIEHRIINEADGIIAECPQDQCDLVDLYDADPEKIRQIPCGFDPTELWPIDKRRAKKYISVPEKEWIVLQVGRIVPRKGIDTAIRGFARLSREADLNSRMIIVGGESRNPGFDSNPEINRLRRLCMDEGILEQVTFAGRKGRQELKYYFSAADVFISTPWYEPFGITPVESMACKTPVIGSAVGGIKYTVVDGGTGYLVPPNDPETVGDHLIELYKNPAKLHRFREQALKRVNSLFTWHRVGKMIADFYQSVLNRIPVIRNSNGKIIEHPAADNRLEVVYRAFESAFDILQKSRNTLTQSILDATELIADCLDKDGKIMVCANRPDARHFAADLSERFMNSDSGGIPVLSLTADDAFMTVSSNDADYEYIFAKQVEALGRPGDLLLAVSTSGQSGNIVKAFTAAQEMKIKCIALLGGDGGELLSRSDLALVVPSGNRERIQETQVLILHLLCELIEKHIISSRTLACLQNPVESQLLNWMDISRTNTGG